MLNAQRAQNAQRGNAIYSNMQYRPMQPYQTVSPMGMSPFANGFNLASFGMPFAAPNMAYQAYPMMRQQPPPQQRPMAVQAYPSPGIVMPPPVVYQPQANNQRPIVYPQSMMQPQPNYPMNSNASRTNIGQPPMNNIMNPTALLNLNPTNMNLGVGPMRNQNRGW
jgi:hypothetical protein